VVRYQDFEEINVYMCAIFLYVSRDLIGLSERKTLLYQTTLYYTANIVS